MLRLTRPRRTTTLLLAGLALGTNGCSDEHAAPTPPATSPQTWTAPSGCAPATNQLTPALNRVANAEPRVFRLPPPPESSVLVRVPEPVTTVTPQMVESERAPLLELLPPIQEDELAGDRGVLDFEEFAAQEPTLAAPPTEVAPADSSSERDRREFVAELPTPSRAYEVDEFDDDAAAAAATSVDDLMAYFPAEDQLSVQFRPRVQEAFTLARHGALHAARARFEQLLVELAQAKDASQMTDRHMRSLAAGLRAIAEADDFAKCTGGKVRPQAIAAGHQTPMLHEASAEWTLAHEATAMYHLYAQQKLAAAVKGEQAGSMMLFGMGKIYAQMADRDDAPQAVRKSLTLYRSAVVAHSENHLAANEAGVLLARAGRYPQAVEMLEHSVKLANASVTHRNLAFVHGKLNRPELAQMHEQTAMQLAQHEMARGQFSAERGIQWVSPDEFNRVGNSAPAANMASVPNTPAQPPASQSAPAPQQRPQTTWW